MGSKSEANQSLNSFVRDSGRRLKGRGDRCFD